MYRGSEWSPEAADDFEALTHTANWIKLLARIVKYEESNVSDVEDDDASENLVPAIELGDTNSEEVSLSCPFFVKIVAQSNASLMPLARTSTLLKN